MMEFDLSASSPVLEIQTTDYTLSRIHENNTSKENGSAAHTAEQNDNLIDLTADSPNGAIAKVPSSAAISPDTAQPNGHSASVKSSIPARNPTVSHVQLPKIPKVPKVPKIPKIGEQSTIPTKSAVPAAKPVAKIAAKKVETHPESPRPLKRQKIEPKTPETPIIRKQEPDVATIVSLLAAAPRAPLQKPEKVVAPKASEVNASEAKASEVNASEAKASEATVPEPKVREVPPHKYHKYIEGDTDDEDSGAVDGARTLETKSALCQLKTRRKQGLAYKIYKHELYSRLNLLVLESRNWTEYVGVFDSAEQATSIGEALVRQISSRVSTGNSASVPKEKFSRQKHSKDPRQEAHERAKVRLRTTKLPMEVNNYFKLVSTGTLVTSGPGYKNYHNANYVFPVGFKSIRNYFCCLNPANKVNYLNEVLRGESGPLFKVTREGTDMSFEGTSASAAWNKLCKKIAERKKELGMVVSQPALSGPGMFGLNVEKVTNLLEGLPNILKLEDYVFQALSQTRSSRSKTTVQAKPRRRKKGEIDKGDEIINKLVQFRIEQKQADVQLI